MPGDQKTGFPPPEASPPKTLAAVISQHPVTRVTLSLYDSCWTAILGELAAFLWGGPACMRAEDQNAKGAKSGNVRRRAPPDRFPLPGCIAVTAASAGSQRGEVI
ncbi:uncharacterized protein LOC144009753 isoform X2 [Festucalex cinctus]